MLLFSCGFRFGVKFLVHPGGSIGDAAVTAAADAFEPPQVSSLTPQRNAVFAATAWSWLPAACACSITEAVICSHRMRVSALRPGSLSVSKAASAAIN